MAPWMRDAAALGAFATVALLLYLPTLDDPMFSDDNIYTVGNPWVTGFSFERLVEMFQPTSAVSTLVQNYAPVALILHAITYSSFGDSLAGHHLLNVVLHAIVSMLLVQLLIRSGVSERLAVFGGLVFLVHPANVEAVAWVSQLKTTAASVFAFAALLLLDRRPALATLAFALALLTKALAAFALPVAAVWLWTRRSEAGAARTAERVRWLIAWGAMLAALAVAQFVALLSAALAPEPLHLGVDTLARTSVSLLMRYLVMATTSYGLSAFHEPPPVTSWLDPWWLGGLVAGIALVVRTLSALRNRSEEAGWWIWVAGSFLPVSQLFPFQFGLADRYLYMMLPGLIGALCLIGPPLYARIRASERSRAIGAAIVGVALVLSFGVRAAQRIRLWDDPSRLVEESIANYPGGMNAMLERSGRAATVGNADEAMAILQEARQRGLLDMSEIVNNPNFSRLHGRADYQALMAEWAARWIEKLRAHDELNQLECYSLGMAHAIRGERSLARRAFEMGLARGGVYDAMLQQKLRELGYRGE